MLTAALTLALTTHFGPDSKSLFKEVSSARMRSTIGKLCSYPTRNTSSDGLSEAALWLKNEYAAIPRIQAELMTYRIEPSRRVPKAKEVVQVLARLPGQDDRMIVIGGHFDSINMTADPLTGRAPGANDDGSGTALALELARVMAPHQWKHTILFCAFSGEEQGLLGSTALAAKAKAEGWKIDAVLNNDMVGNAGDSEGQIEKRYVRLFSDNPDDKKLNPQRSRDLALFVEWITRGSVPGQRAKLVLRRDRFGRGGDHTPFSEQGFSAVRFTDAIEEYSRQHTPNDLPEFIDWRYLTNNARLNLAALSTLANAGEPPHNLRLDMHQGHHTTLQWKASPDTGYVVYWRETESSVWQGAVNVGHTDHATLPQSKDDFFFAVGAEGGIPVNADR